MTPLHQRVMAAIAATPNLTTYGLAHAWPELNHSPEHLQPILKRLEAKGEIKSQVEYHPSGKVKCRRWSVIPTGRKNR